MFVMRHFRRPFRVRVTNYCLATVLFNLRSFNFSNFFYYTHRRTSLNITTLLCNNLNFNHFAITFVFNYFYWWKKITDIISCWNNCFNLILIDFRLSNIICRRISCFLGWNLLCYYFFLGWNLLWYAFCCWNDNRSGWFRHSNIVNRLAFFFNNTGWRENIWFFFNIGRNEGHVDVGWTDASCYVIFLVVIVA